MRLAADGASRGALRYKLIAPAPPPGAVRRDGILAKIAQNPTASMVLLQGPAGHGKSTTLQQLKEAAEAQGRLTGWLTFDAGDNDPRRFLAHFEELVESLSGHAGGARKRGREGRLEDLDGRTDSLFDRLYSLDRPVSLFLDELQTLTDKTVLGFFRSLFERSSDAVRICAGSRSLPDVGLSRLVVNRRALILQADDLRFTLEETGRFFSAAGELGVDGEEVGTIYRRTEGWPAALQLFRLTLGSPAVRKSLGDPDARAPRELAEYLAENVLALQPQPIQDFLLRTAKLTRLNDRLCDEVLGARNSREILHTLERSGLFLRCVDPQEGWFKYHTLFSSILGEQLSTQNPELAQEVHRRAARWYMKEGLFEEAVQHATICGEYTLAADALNAWSTRLIAGAHLRTVEYWCARLPFDEILARPDLAIKYAYALVFLRRRQSVKPLLEVLRQRTQGGSAATTSDPNIVLSMAAISCDDIEEAFRISDRVPLDQQDIEGFAAFELAAAANLRAYCALVAQEPESACECLNAARAYNESADAAFSRDCTIAVGAAAQILQGNLREALARFEQALREQGPAAIRHSGASSALFSCYVWALYEANELDQAEAIFARHREVIRGSMRTDFLSMAYLAMARIHDAKGRPAQADAILDEAEAIGRGSGWERLVVTVKWERVRRALARGDVERAEAIAATARSECRLPAGWIPIANDIEDREFGEIRLALARADFDEAAARIQAELKRQRGRVLRKIRLRVLSAVLGARAGDPAAARREMRAALRLARSGGYIRSILDEGEEAVKLLRQEYRALLERRGAAHEPGSEREFLEILLRAAGVPLGRRASQACSIQPLTDRERELLELLAHGKSNKDAANRLFVSENTVKFHLKNIYAKLSVSSRVCAITAAREIGIIQ